jgi:hypothetical protein
MFPKFMTLSHRNRYSMVIAGLTRNPVVAQHWIPDQVRDDSCEVRKLNNRCAP